MKVSYQYRKEDYLSALMLQAANSRKDAWLLQLAGKIAVGCAVYLSTATLRGTLSVNDNIAYAAALIVIMGLLLLGSPRILPSLLFNYHMASGRIPAGVIGSHEMEAGEDMLTFRCAGMEHRMRYSNLVRINANKEAVLFYQQNGAVEFVPTRAFGFTYERGEALEQLEGIINAGRESEQATTVIPSHESAGQKNAKYTISAQEYLAVNAAHVRYKRIAGLKDPKTLFWALILLWIGLGSVKGLVDRFRGVVPPMGIVTVYYVLGILALVLGALLLFQPVKLANWGLRQKLRMEQYPYGFFGPRKLHWTDQWVAFEYGLIGTKLAWSYFTNVESDDAFIYFYQNDNLALFVPKSGLGSHRKDFERAAGLCG
ncbi:MAG: YcxB family protein [Bacillota bacterium]